MMIDEDSEFQQMEIEGRGRHGEDRVSQPLFFDEEARRPVCSRCRRGFWRRLRLLCCCCCGGRGSISWSEVLRDCHGTQIILLIPFGICGLSFVIWVLVRFSTALVEDTCPRFPGEMKRFVPAREVLVEPEFRSRPGGYALQGFSMGEDNAMLYAFYTKAARKFRLDPTSGSVEEILLEKIYNLGEDFGLIIENPVKHIGGIDLAKSDEHGEELWLACHGDGLAGEGALFAIDPVSLDVKRERIAARVSGKNWDWLAFDRMNERLLYGTFFNVTTLYWVGIQNLDLSGSIEIKFNSTDPYRRGGFQFIQSAAVDARGDLFLLSDNFHTTIFKVNLETGMHMRAQNLFTGNEADGLTFNLQSGTMIAGFNRANSHEQTMGAPPIVSALEFVYI